MCICTYILSVFFLGSARFLFMTFFGITGFVMFLFTAGATFEYRFPWLQG